MFCPRVGTAVLKGLRACLQGTIDRAETLILAHNIALFTVALGTSKRGDELTRTLSQRILRLPPLRRSVQFSVGKDHARRRGSPAGGSLRQAAR